MNEKMRSSVMGLILGQFSSPLPMAQKEPVAYLYNGVVLPKLPEWDKTVYPYAFIYYYGFAEMYRVVFSNKQGVATASRIKGYDATTIVYCAQGGLWELDDTYSNAGVPNTDFRFELPIWANYDVLNETDSTVYLSASEPIPVYE